MYEQIITIDSMDKLSALFGSFDKNVALLEKEYNVKLISRGSSLKITGENEGEVEKAAKAIGGMLAIINTGQSLNDQNVNYIMTLTRDGDEQSITKLAGSDCICITAKGKPIRPKTLGQKHYVESIKRNTVVFGVGPAGTGKTYLAVAMAVNAFKAKQINRIILTRPAVEAGEKLGFLPGDLQSKVDPYLRPLYDGLFDMLGADTFHALSEKGAIEVAPLAYMRGRTLDDSFIILDEAQNTTKEQMKMFLTRFGFNSKIVVTGDITQIDLPEGKRSGLIEATRILKNIDGIDICRFSEKDVVRHRLVQEIIKAYERNEEAKKQNGRDS